MKRIAIIVRIFPIVLPVATECDAIVFRIDAPILDQSQWIFLLYLLQFGFIFIIQRDIVGWKKHIIIQFDC